MPNTGCITSLGAAKGPDTYIVPGPFAWDRVVTGRAVVLAGALDFIDVEIC